MAQPTNLTIDGLNCVCVPLNDANFSDIGAIYIILCVAQGGAWTIIDIGQSSEVGTRIDSHDRRECWRSKCPNNNIWVCVYPIQDKQARLNLEHQLRLKHSNLCGQR